jgi:hypothetical protein
VETIWATIQTGQLEEHSGAIGAASLLLSVVTLTLFVVIQFYRPWKRRRDLAQPFAAHFLIPAAGQTPLNYVQQDHREHLVKELVVPPNSIISVQIAVVPRLSFLEREFYFGCEENLVDPQKPQAIEYFVPFVAEGIRGSGKPDADHPGHYRDIHGFYHVREDFLYTNDTRIIGFKLKTGATTRVYSAQLYTVTDVVRGRADLKIRVEHPAKTKMRCYQTVDHRFFERCFVVPTGGVPQPCE